MKRTLGIAGLLAAVLSMGLQAQQWDAREAKIPFDFWVGHTLMPAGEYSVYHTPAGTIAIKGDDGTGHAAVVLANRLSRPDAQSEGKLVFKRYGEVYFLSMVWVPGKQDGFSIPKTSRERELASKNVPSKATGIALLPK